MNLISCLPPTGIRIHRVFEPISETYDRISTSRELSGLRGRDLLDLQGIVVGGLILVVGRG